MTNYNMHDLMKERDFQTEIDSAINNKDIKEYIFSLKYEREAKKLEIKSIMPTLLLSKAMAIALTANGMTESQLTHFLNEVYINTLNEINKGNQNDNEDI